MMNYFSGIRPNDQFIVSTNYVRSKLTEDILKELYIPLIGLESVAVYQYLSQFLTNQQRSNAKTHYLILNELKMNLSRFEKLREQLEGIGLLKTYLQVNDDAQKFVYKLLSPVMPQYFFNDPMLSVFLFQVVGKERYNELKDKFSHDPLDLSEYKDVSKNYMDVFGTPKEPSHDLYDRNERLLKTQESLGIPVHQQSFDFDLLEMLLSQNLMTRETLPKQTRNLIAQLAALYEITPTDMHRIILKSLTSNQTISHEDLRKNARDYYQIEHSGELPELKVVEEEVQTASKLTFFERMDVTSPVEMLASFSKSEPTIKQKRMIEMILEREKLPFGVMNMLLQYVMLTKDMQLPQSYIEEVASNWKKLGIASSEEAYHHVMKLKENQQENKKKQENYRTNKRPQTSYEKTPAWVEALSEGKDINPTEKQDDAAIEEKRRQLEEKLKNNFWEED